MTERRSEDATGTAEGLGSSSQPCDKNVEHSFLQSVRRRGGRSEEAWGRGLGGRPMGARRRPLRSGKSRVSVHGPATPARAAAVRPRACDRGGASAPLRPGPRKRATREGAQSVGPQKTRQQRQRRLRPMRRCWRGPRGGGGLLTRSPRVWGAPTAAPRAPPDRPRPRERVARRGRSGGKGGGGGGGWRAAPHTGRSGRGGGPPPPPAPPPPRRPPGLESSRP
jgi:hypothetical protein